MKPRKHAELIKAWADGAEIEYLYTTNIWKVTETPYFDDETQYRIKPANKVLDWSKMPVDTYIEIDKILIRHFAGISEDSVIRYFNSGADSKVGVSTSGSRIDRVILAKDQPWQPWFGGECPVPDGVIVEFKVRGVDIKPYSPSVGIGLGWDHKLTMSDWDIIAYRIVGLAEGWSEQ